MLARVRTQIKKKRYTERLRDNVQTSIEMAITDALTGLFNRRYMETHLATLVEQAANRGKPIAVLILDIDYFKSINDGHGHDAGDDVLREFALRIRKSIRNIDLACRYGGEEFVIVMPETDMAVATVVAERLRRRIANEPFAIQDGKQQPRRHHLDRHRRLERAGRHCRRHPQARRPGALPRQARRPQSGGAGGRVSAAQRNCRIFNDLKSGLVAAHRFGLTLRRRSILATDGDNAARPERHIALRSCPGPPHLLGPAGFGRPASGASGLLTIASGRPPFPP